MAGKLIVIYGTNNLGKSTQAKLLVARLNQQGYTAEYLKYPIYDLSPTGPQINNILRQNKKQTISEIELQKLYAQNRRDYQPELKKKLRGKTIIVAEDYIGTGLAWGITKGEKLETLLKQNQGLLKENLAILLDGQPFISGKEDNHLHESNDELMQRCRIVHQKLAKKFDWQIVKTNQTIKNVSQQIWLIVENFLSVKIPRPQRGGRRDETLF